MATMSTEPTTMPAQPTVEQVLAGMAAQVGGQLPRMVELAATVMPEMVLKHAQDGGFAMHRCSIPSLWSPGPGCGEQIGPR